MSILFYNVIVFSLLSIAVFFSILFIQSGLDKIMDFRGNLDYFKSHFANTILANFIYPLLVLITLLECITGLVFIAAVVDFLFAHNGSTQFNLFFLGCKFSSITLLCLFLGQRLAKDYAGAVNLVIYFIVNLIALAFLFIAK